MQHRAFLEALPDHQVEALKYLFDFWAMPHQVPPEGDWRTWMIMGGRGAGKTRAGAEWVRSMLEGPTPLAAGTASRMALVGDTFDQVREVMVMGDSGILSVCPKDRRPRWNGTRKMLEWPNGATAQAFTAQDPEGLRGPQFDSAWADELAKWRNAQKVWDMLQFGLRLGDAPKVCVTTTPRNVPLIVDLLERENTVTTHATTYANAANLAEGFLDELRARYDGTRDGLQEVEGVLLTDAPGALWNTDILKNAQTRFVPDLDRIVVAVDPPVTSNKSSDECGIVVAGVVTKGKKHEWKAYVLEDLSLGQVKPSEWAKIAVDAYHRYGAVRMVVETNQGGEMVKSVVHQEDGGINFDGKHAQKAKQARAEPVASIYEQGRVFHAPGLGQLEDQMCQMTITGFKGQGSPDRVDALVWALHALLIEPEVEKPCNARVRVF